MARYVDGFIVPIPAKNVEAYRKVARKAGKVWMEYGALEYVECVADDVKPGKLTSFPQSVKLKADEVVAFSWIVYKSRKHRDTVNASLSVDFLLEGANATALVGLRVAKLISSHGLLVSVGGSAWALWSDIGLKGKPAAGGALPALRAAGLAAVDAAGSAGPKAVFSAIAQGKN